MLWGWSFPALELIVKVALWIAFAAGGIAAVSAFIAGYVGYELTDAVQKEADLRIVEAQSRGEEAKARAAVAEQKAAEAQLALEKFKAPRILNQDQQARIAEKLKPFAGAAYDTGMGPKGDPESLYILRSIHAALLLANWNHIAWTGGGETYTEPEMPPIGLTTVTNVIVDVHPDRWEKLGPAATALAAALAAEGIDAIADSKSTSVNSDAIHIRIGRKL
jgi:hypothetical protein